MIVRRIMITIYVLLVLAWGKLLYNHIMLDKYIDKYNAEKYDSNYKTLKILNVFEGYVVHYNEGNQYYQKGEYENAIKCYDKALEARPRPVNEEGPDCDIRINKVLAMVYNLGDDYDKAENKEASLKVLYECKDILIDKDCASTDRNIEYHNETSQNLLKEIERLIKKLEEEDEKQNQDNNENKDGDSDNKDQNDEESKKSEDEKIKEQLKDVNDNAFKERSTEIDEDRETKGESGWREDGIW